MNNFCRFAATAAIATLVAGGSASANPFEFLFGPHRAPVQAHAYANPYGDGGVRADLRRQIVDYRTSEAPGTIIVDTPNMHLYFVLGGGKAVRYGIGVGREGFTWSGIKTVERKAEWPDWTPPPEMIGRQPYLPRFMAGGPTNPLGARAMYLSGSVYRIHGTNAPGTIGAPKYLGLHPHAQRGRDRPLQPRQDRHQGRGAADDQPPRSGPLGRAAHERAPGRRSQRHLLSAAVSDAPRQ